MNKWLAFALLMLIGSVANSQAIPESEIILFKKQRYGGLNLNTFGYGATATFGKYTEARKLRLLTADLTIVKHEKEVKTWGNDPSGRSYFYGKENSFITLRTLYGKKYVIAEKLRRSGVQVACNWQVGPVFGFTKPVYLEILNNDSQTGSIDIEKFDVDKHYIDNIRGRASGLRGLNELKFYTGATVKFAFIFEYSNERERLKGIETGLALDVFGKRIPIMAEKILSDDINNPKNHQAFFSMYINFFFGTKYDQR